MPRIEYPEFGPVNERSFPAAALDDGLRDSLEDFKSRGLIHEYRIENDTLTLWRPWIQGQTQDEFFRGLLNVERTNYSHQFFRRVQRKLEEIGNDHGSLHPRNIILRQGGGLELVDAIFNCLRLSPFAVPQDDPWLWGPCVPKDWTLKDWDRVSLLRTATLLAQDPATWEKPIPTQQAAEMCRKWVDGFIQSTPVGADLISTVSEASNLLPRLADAIYEIPREALIAQPDDRIEVAGPSPPRTEEGVGLSVAVPVVAPELSTEPLPETGRGLIPKERCDMPHSNTVSMKKAIAKNRTAWQVCAFTIGVALAIVGVIVSKHDGVLDLGELRSSLWGPSGIEQVNFSDLIHDRHKGRKVVYVFALDVSGSLYEAEVSEGEKEFFIERMTADKLDEAYDKEELMRRCGLTVPRLKQWHLARAQICYYLHGIEDGAYAGLWKFGAVPTIAFISRAEQLEQNRTPGEEGARKRLIERLMSDDMVPRRGTPDFDRTDFESLFNQLYREYVRSAGYGDKDLRFVVVSDFLHDAGTRDPARYSLSRQKIEKRLRDFRRADNVTFHLMVIGSNENDMRFMLPSIRKSTRWNQYVVDSFQREPARPMPDFLYGFVPAERELVFRHADNSEKIHPVHLMWDMSKSDDSQLIVGLRTAAHRASNDDLSIHVSEGRPDTQCALLDEENTGQIELESAVLRSGERQDFTIGRPGDWICLQPLSVEKERIYRYQLTLTCESDRVERSVHVVNVRFKKYMPESAAWVLIVCFVSILFAPFICIVMTLVSMIRRRAPDRQSSSEAGGRA